MTLKKDVIMLTHNFFLTFKGEQYFETIIMKQFKHCMQ